MLLSLTNSDQQAEISDNKIILAIYSWRLKSDGRGMFYVAMTKRRGNRFQTIYLHNLIYAMTHGKRKKKLEIHHKDFNTLNNRDDNFEQKRKGTHSAMVCS